ncbi:hypothetical protein [Candidatus Nitrosocosmicus hydrocola]|jgi:hypothetical protein|uniref:hypothetical protein n=1 Tax=Candidatus Nitrosocosmicus hydrocola TaxID=1826872 RepID=UPI0011E5AABF|nr:hypothetical protein [Candidatus Nitrosocosmicus hydrocola]
MTPISNWKRWIIYNLIGEGVHNVLFDDQLKKLCGNNYDGNFEIALNSLVDGGILLRLETHRRKKFIVNYDRLIEAKKILNDNRNWKLNRDAEQTNRQGHGTSDDIHRFYSEPEGYSFWFNLEENPRKKRSIYNIYRKKTDDLEFAAQILTQKHSKILYLGSLRHTHSVISILWRACVELSNGTELANKRFILQDLQDKERKACGNNRQRGKIALVIFKKMEFIVEKGKKGNSTMFAATGRSPPFSTLDDVINL